MIMLSCQKVSELVSQSLDRPLGLRERIGLKLHLAMCRMCNRYRRQITFLSDSARAMLHHPRGAQDLDTELTAEARERCRRAIEEAEKREE